jgi:hypothetical protein
MAQDVRHQISLLSHEALLSHFLFLLSHNDVDFQARAMLGSYRRDVRVDPSLPHAFGS